jgi:hypothetical protein
MSERKNIDKLFQEKLKNFETVPPQEVWNNIKIELEKKKKRRMIPLWWKLSGIAALLFLGLWISNALFFDSATNEIVIKEESKITANLKVKNPSSSNRFKTNKKIVVTNTSVFSNKKNKLNQTEKSENIKKDKVDDLLVSDKIQKNNAGLSSQKLAQFVMETSISNSSSAKDNIVYNELNLEINNNVLDIITAENSKAISPTDTNKMAFSDNQSIKANTDKTFASLEENKKAKEIPNSQPNELDKILKEKAKKSSKQKNQNRWQINPTVAPIYYSSMVDGSSLDSKFDTNKKVYNTSKSIGVGVNYSLNKKVKIRTGINALSVNYDTYDIQLNPTIGNESSLTIQGASFDFGFVGISQHSPNPQISVNQQMGYFELPLEISYSILNKKIGIDLIGGMSTLFLNQNSISTSVMKEKISLGQANNLNNVHFSGNIGLGLKYEILKQLDFKVEPVFKYQINTYNSLNSNSKPYILGIYSGIGFSF